MRIIELLWVALFLAFLSLGTTAGGSSTLGALFGALSVVASLALARQLWKLTRRAGR